MEKYEKLRGKMVDIKREYRYNLMDWRNNQEFAAMSERRFPAAVVRSKQDGV